MGIFTTTAILKKKRKKEKTFSKVVDGKRDDLKDFSPRDVGIKNFR